jgi:hypothetical protein
MPQLRACQIHPTADVNQIMVNVTHNSKHSLFRCCCVVHRYTLVSNAITDLPYLKPAVALVLGFVGGKMVAEYFHYELGVGISLSVVATLLAAGVGASVWANKRNAHLARMQARGSPLLV